VRRDQFGFHLRREFELDALSGKFLEYRQADATTVSFHTEGLRIDRWALDVGHSGSPPNHTASSRRRFRA
jgi:hypothetical protein